jgi:hypothetical protein
MPVPDDPSVLDVDVRPELVRLAKPIRPAKLLEVLELIGRRLVVVGDAHLERDLREAGDGLRRDPGDRRHGRFDPGAGHVGHLIVRDDPVPFTFPATGQMMDDTREPVECRSSSAALSIAVALPRTHDTR